MLSKNCSEYFVSFSRCLKFQPAFTTFIHILLSKPSFVAHFHSKPNNWLSVAQICQLLFMVPGFSDIEP